MNTPFCLDAEKPLTESSIWFLKPASHIVRSAYHPLVNKIITIKRYWKAMKYLVKTEVGCYYNRHGSSYILTIDLGDQRFWGPHFVEAVKHRILNYSTEQCCHYPFRLNSISVTT